MALARRLGLDDRRAVRLELDEIQATVLRYRPAPYFGSHVLLRVYDARAGREFPPPSVSAVKWLADLKG